MRYEINDLVTESMLDRLERNSYQNYWVERLLRPFKEAKEQEISEEEGYLDRLGVDDE